MNDLHIKPELLHALKNLTHTSFTVAELTQAYLDDPQSKHKSKKAARQFVYRNMVRMIKTGLMERLASDEGWPRYRLRPNFRTAASFHENQSPGARSEPKPPTLALPEKTARPINALKERLSKHKSDMLCAMGEAEEYSALCTELPELCSEAQELYNEARERSAMLLGRIKALESLLSHSAG